MDIDVVIAIRLLGVAFVLLGAYIMMYKRSYPLFLLLYGAISAAAFALLVDNLDLALWGLQGDEITIAAMYQTFASLGAGADFAYHHLPPFYPPGFFWLVSAIGAPLQLSGVGLMKLAGVIGFATFPLGTYLLAVVLHKKEGGSNMKLMRAVAFLAPLFMLVIIGVDPMLGKPYEVLALGATIFWTLSLWQRAHADNWNKWDVLLYGIIGGIIAMVYYLWLAFAAISLLLAIVFIKRRLRYLLRLMSAAIVSFIILAPYAYPLFKAYTAIGMENWQTAFFVPDGLALWLPMVTQISVQSLLMLFGLCGMVYFWQKKPMKLLASMLASAYVWWIMGLCLLLFFDTPFQEFRGFYLYAPAVLGTAAAFSAVYAYKQFDIANNKRTLYTISAVLLLVLCANSVFGTFIDDPKLQEYRTEAAKIDEETGTLAQFLGRSDTTVKTLHSVPQVQGFVPVNNVLYFNQHNNHPAALFSERMSFVESLAKATTTEQLTAINAASKFGPVERFIFFDDKQGGYYLFFHVDAFGKGIEEKIIEFDANLFSKELFVERFKNRKYVVIERKTVISE